MSNLFALGVLAFGIIWQWARFPGELYRHNEARLAVYRLMCTNRCCGHLLPVEV